MGVRFYQRNSFDLLNIHLRGWRTKWNENRTSAARLTGFLKGWWLQLDFSFGMVFIPQELHSCSSPEFNSCRVRKRSLRSVQCNRVPVYSGLELLWWANSYADNKQPLNSQERSEQPELTSTQCFHQRDNTRLTHHTWLRKGRAWPPENQPTAACRDELACSICNRNVWFYFPKFLIADYLEVLVFNNCKGQLELVLHTSLSWVELETLSDKSNNFSSCILSTIYF